MKNHHINVMFPVNQWGVGGAEQQLLELLKGIDKGRFKPVVVSLYPGGALEPEVKALPDVEMVCLHRKSTRDFSVFPRMKRLLHEKQIDVIQPFLTPATLFGLVPALLERTPVKVVTERCGGRLNAPLGNRLYRKIEDIFTRYADWVVPNSESGRSYLMARGINPARIRVIYNGINIQRLHPDPAKINQIRQSLHVPADGLVVGITASLSRAKDHATFLRAAKLVAQALPNTRFAILGDGPLRPNLETLTHELGLEKNVTFCGRQREVGSYVSTFDIFCLSSVEIEGCSNAILEAMALGKPVVATEVGGNKELVQPEETGLLVPPANPPALAEALIRCLKQRELAQQMGRRGQALVHTRFSLENMVRQYEMLYEDTLAKKGIKK